MHKTTAPRSEIDSFLFFPHTTNNHHHHLVCCCSYAAAHSAAVPADAMILAWPEGREATWESTLSRPQLLPSQLSSEPVWSEDREAIRESSLSRASRPPPTTTKMTTTTTTTHHQKGDYHHTPSSHELSTRWQITRLRVRTLLLGADSIPLRRRV